MHLRLFGNEFGTLWLSIPCCNGFEQPAVGVELVSTQALIASGIRCVCSRAGEAQRMHFFPAFRFKRDIHRHVEKAGGLLLAYGDFRFAGLLVPMPRQAYIPASRAA